MSTKIYDAYKYSGTPDELMKWLFKFRQKYKDESIKELYPFFISASEYFKSISIPTELSLCFENPLNYLSTSRGIKMIIRKGLNEPLNIDASVVVYFHKRIIVVQFFGLDFGFRKLRECINRSKKFVDFSYWDNTDSLDEISDEEWDARKKFYDSLTEKYYSFNSVGLTYELSNTETILSICKGISERIRKNEVS